MTKVTIDVEVDLDEFCTDDLVAELNRRAINHNVPESLPAEQLLDLIKQIYQLRRIGQEYQRELDKLFYLVLNKVV
jgi:hypothetical protein